MQNNSIPPNRQSRRRLGRLKPRAQPQHNAMCISPGDHRLLDGDSRPEFPRITPKDLPADIVLARLSALHLRIMGRDPKWQAKCPSHPDTRPSLSLTETDDGLLLMHCWGGCKTEDVLAALGLTLSALYPSLYAIQFGRRGPRVLNADHHRPVAVDDEPSAKVCEVFAHMLRSCRASGRDLDRLSAQLVLPRRALVALQIGYHAEGECWIFPERDDQGRIFGLVRRYHDGSKRAAIASKRGLSIPRYEHGVPAGPLHIAEGATDTAALVSVGVFAIGRASAEGSTLERLWLCRFLKEHEEREIIVVGDRDPSGAGERGAKKLAVHLSSELRRDVSWALPRKSFKDVRDQIVSGKWNLGLSIQEVHP